MKQYLLLTSAFVAGGLLSGTAGAACIKTPSCSSLGYTSTSSCTGGTKCPFGNYWNCTGPNNTNKITELTNKITELEKVIEELQQNSSSGKGDTSNCIAGSIFYSDWTCSYGSIVPTKAPIGVVVLSDNQGHGQVMALNSLGYFKFSDGGDIPTLNNYTSIEAASKDLASCKNTAIILAAGNHDAYPAAWAAYDYQIAGTEVGDWCLPAAGVMTSIKSNFSTINNGFNIAGGKPLEMNDYIWSSTECDNIHMWYSLFNSSYGITDHYFSPGNYIYKNYGNEVRPVLEF